MAAYRAREVKPLKLDWNGMTIHTPPLTSPGAMMLEAISILKVLDWPKLSRLERFHAKLEALRIAWADRMNLFGDPEQVKVPIDKLLSQNYAGEMAEKIRIALKEMKPVPLKIDSIGDEGTINISAIDRKGNMAAITLTHGSSYGARVSVEELGMVLGHGMWRFDPRPGRPNSPGPGKRCVNNMCPTVVTRDGKPILVVGGAGGTRIPNSIYEVLIHFVGLGKAMDEAMKVPRMETSGTLKLGLEKGHSPEEEAFLKKIGYNVSSTYSAYVSAASFDARTGTARGISTGGI
jgi:gamma-glutamyltranspeptidase/glutathione hydrolase